MSKSAKNLIRKILNYFSYDIQKINYPIDKFPIVEAKDEIKDIIKQSKDYSMTNEVRMYALCQSIQKIYNEKLEGDFVECGVWKGGNLILMTLLNEYYKLSKKIYGFDTFEGMTKPTSHDVDLNNNLAANRLKKEKRFEDCDNIWCFSPLESVKKNLSKFSDLKNINLIKGSVQETLLEEKNLPEKISLLFLDTDFYESTKQELEMLYPKLVKGGILLIDDYGHWQGARKAVDEYFENKKDVWLQYIDYSCRLIVK